MDLLVEQRAVPSVCLDNGKKFPKNRTFSCCMGSVEENLFEKK